MHSVETHRSSVLTYDNLTARQLEQVMEVCGRHKLPCIIRTSLAQSRDRRTEDCTYMCFIVFNGYLEKQLTQTLDELNLSNAAYLSLSVSGPPGGLSRGWYDILQTTLTDWLDTDGLWKRENRSKLNHH